MVERIEELLVKNNCVIIPGFGAFIGNYNPAEIRMSESKIFPPSKNIAFNRTLKANDGLLVNYIAQQNAISYSEAEIKVAEFSKYCNEFLAQNKSLIFKNIGRLTLDTDDKIQFKAFLVRNYLIESFGLQPMTLSPISRLKDTGVLIKSTQNHTIHPDLLSAIKSPNRKFKKKYLLLASIIGIVCLTGTIIGVNVNKHSNISTSSLVPTVDIVKSTTTNTPTAEPTVIDAISTTETNTIANNIASDNDKVSENTSLNNKSYILIGSFFDNSRANKLKLESDNLGYNTFISNNNSDSLYRVAIAVDNNNIESTLVGIKSTLNTRAWVYCVNCNLQ